MTTSDPTTRFTRRVDDYHKYRPSYPAELKTFLQEQLGLQPQTVIADLGAGTGISTQLLLETGSQVIAVEPNDAMRSACQRLLGKNPRLTIINGTAESTTLPTACCDVITSFQAFHWFEPAPCRAEFIRLLRAPGWVVLVWNDRCRDETPFLTGYGQLFQRWCLDYAQVIHRQVATPQNMATLFGSTPIQRLTLPNNQLLDFAALAGGLRSSSYAPLPEDAHYAPMMRDLQALFEQHQHQGQVEMRYHTEVYYGQFR